MKRLIPIALGILIAISTEMTSQNTYNPEITILKPNMETIDEMSVEIVDNETEIVLMPQETEETETEPKLVSLGTFLITAYCPCTKCSDNWGTLTSTGVTAEEGRTIAVDPKVIPYGSKIVFNGKEYTAEDCGGAIKEKRIDLYFESHQDAWDWGMQYYEVFILVESED